MDFLVTNTKKQVYTKLGSRSKGNTLCLFQYVEKHGQTLKEMIEEKQMIRKFFMFTEALKRKSEKIRFITEKSDNIIVEAGTFSTGINIGIS